MDTPGFDNTAGCPPRELEKVWSKRSMSQMSDFGTIPIGLPLGLTDAEKKLWLAMYVKARELIYADVEESTVRSAVLLAIRTLFPKRDSHEFIFGMRQQRSLMSCLAMRQDYCSTFVSSSDV